MAASIESLVTTDGSEQSPWNLCFWDSCTGAVQGVFKGGLSSQSGVATIGHSFLLSSQKDKPIIQVWELNKKEQLHKRMVVPGKVSALCVCPNGVYCLAAIQESFHLWEIRTGQLLAVVSRHFQPITSIKFTDDGSNFLTAGEDGYIYLWSISSILIPKGPSPEPIHTYQKHSLQVTNLAVGVGGIYGKFASVSNDHSCRVYNLISGKILASFILEVALTSVVIDPAEYHLFLGAVDGNIFQIDLFSTPPSKDIHLTDEEKKEKIFNGHTKQVTSLGVSLDGNLLCSGSYDHTARIWHIPSKQCLRVLSHKGPVLNTFFMQTPVALTNNEVYQTSHTLAMFQRELRAEDNDKKTSQFFIKAEKEQCQKINLGINNKAIFLTARKANSKYPGESRVALQEALTDAKKVNQQLYDYAVEAILGTLRSSDDSS